MNLYIVIPQIFAEYMEGVASTVVNGDHFSHAVTTDGRYVTATLAMTNFPAEFIELANTGWSMNVVAMGSEDFPQPEEE